MLCSHVNNIHHKILEIQQQLSHSTQHMNTGDIIQIEAPDFDPDIDEGLPTQEQQEAQGLPVLHNNLSKNLMNTKPLLYRNEM